MNLNKSRTDQTEQHRTDTSAAQLGCVSALLLVILLLTASADSPKTFQERLKTAERAFQAEQWQEALRFYQELADEAPDFPIVHVGIGDAAVKLRDYPTAITAFQHALQHLSTQPPDTRLRVTLQAKLAAAYHRNKQLDPAAQWFQEAVKGAGEDTPAAWYVALGQIETERGNLEQARRYYSVTLQLHPRTTAAYNNLGHVLLKLNRLDEADAVFREALTQDATLASAAFGRGEVGRRRGQHAVARRFYELAIQHAPDEPVFHKSLVELLRTTGAEADIAAAEARYRRTLAQRYQRQAHQLIEQKALQRALGLLQKAVEADDTFIAALKDYAYLQMQLGTLEAAKRSYQRVLATEPTSRQARLHLGKIETALGDPDAAASHYLALIRHDPDFMETYVQLAALRERRGDVGGAAEAFSMGLRHVPTWAPGYVWRGQLYRKHGRSDMAEPDFRQAIRLAPDVPFPKDALAGLLAAEGRDLQEALSLAESVVKRDNRPVHRATLARVYYRLDRTSEARREIEAAFAESPENTYILEIRTEILKPDP